MTTTTPASDVPLPAGAISVEEWEHIFAHEVLHRFFTPGPRWPAFGRLS
jgi:hypothetical protein